MSASLDQPERCEICGESIGIGEEIAEMYDVKWPADRPSVICHAQCGLWKGMLPA